jgi:hypothetical protein
VKADIIIVGLQSSGGGAILSPENPGADTMFAQSMAKTEMTRFWQFMFDYCHEDYSCVLGWGMAGVIAFLGVVMCFGYFITRLNKRQ